MSIYFHLVDKNICYMTINILDSDWTKHYFTLHFKMWLSTLKSAHEVNITFEHCSVYSKIVTGKVQVAYFENVFSDWSIFKEVVLLSKQLVIHLLVLCLPHIVFLFATFCLFWILFIFRWKSQVDKRLAQALPWGTAYFFLWRLLHWKQISLTSDLLI